MMSGSVFVARWRATSPGLGGRFLARLDRWRDGAGQALASRGAPTRFLGERWRRHAPAAEAAVERWTVHPATIVPAALPLGVERADALPDVRGWWGFSARDVARREAGATCVLTIPDARVLAGRTPAPGRDFSPAILDRAGRSLDLREIRFRPFHAPLARRAAALRLEHAVWIAERVFDNYAHWVTAHLGKAALVRDLGLAGDLVLPERLPAWAEAGLLRLGIDPARCARLPDGAVLEADRLTLVECDRFRPELLALAREAMAGRPAAPARRRVLISRRHARGRRLVDEDALAPLCEAYALEPVAMERLGLDEQVALMAETALLVAPHGAGLANMLFCPPGATIVEIVDPAYPNPNFYAMAAALGHAHVWLEGRGVGAGHPLDRDLAVDAQALRAALERAT